MRKIYSLLSLFKTAAVFPLTLALAFAFVSAAECKVSGSVTLEGTLTDEDSSAAVEGAAVSAGGRAVKSDSSGKYVLSGLLPGRIIVEVKKEGYETFGESVKVTKGSNSFNIKLKASGAAAGRGGVITEDRRETAAGQSYEEMARRSQERRQNYRLGAVSEKVPAASVKGTNYVAGKVIDMASGVPIARARVVLDGEAYFSDAAGEFVSRPITRAQASLKADAPSYNAYESNIKITGGKNKLKILLMPLPENSSAYTGFDKGKLVEYSKFSQRYASVSGHVRDAKTKEPVSNATVIIGNKSAQTNAQGFYGIDGLAMGNAAVTIIAGSYGVYKGSLEVSKVTNVNDVSLTADEKFGAVSGTVVEKETGRPIHGARVQIGNRIVVSDQYGSFTVKDIPYDYYNLTVDQKGYQRIEKAISVNQDNITVGVELADEYMTAR